MAGILGVGTGIKIDEIVAALVNAERAPKTLQLDRLEKATTARFSGLSAIKGALSGLQSAIQGLGKSSVFDARTASSSNTGVLSAKAESSAIAGKYSVQVQQLATSSKVGLQSVSSSSSTTFNTGKLTISTGSSNFNVNVTKDNNTLAGVRDAINAQGKTAGVSATIVTDASGSRLVLSSNKTGAGNDIEVAATEDGVKMGTVALTTQAFKPSVSLSLPSFAGGSTSTFQGGNLEINAGSVNLNVAIPDGFTLEDVRDLVNINGNSQGISAAIETDSSGSRLVLNSTNGADLTLNATSTGGSGANALTALNPASGAVATSSSPSSSTGAAGVISKAQSAVLFVDGLQVVSESNSVTSAIDGVTLNLAGAQSAADITAGKTVDITVGVDKGSIKSNLQKFVDSYNTLMNTAAAQTAVVPVGEGENPVTGALVGDATVRLLIGEGWGQRSPVAVYMPTLYLDVQLPAGGAFELPPLYEERAVYAVDQDLQLGNAALAARQMAVLPAGETVRITAGTQPARLVVIGGAPLDGPRHMWWNFVSSRKERILQAAEDWEAQRMGQVGGETEFIPLPERRFVP